MKISDRDGRVSGNDATKFFAVSKLSRQELKQVWAVAESKRHGFLGLAEFIIAMKLISLAQEGHEITSDLLKGFVDMKTVELPLLEGLENVLLSHKSRQKLPSTNQNLLLSQPQVTSISDSFTILS
ncbi:PREDICTED: EH domain-containing protein 2-like isoform X2 [Camelina sativa]|uniref:EH domain-containing protein 2-like isoform X2 n=1 Tax=Camelina sativa TaxID=90675 RepID=A0ABM0X674_CAMSA|nr:PREDICTED: EH domain-containing protein 2-like isoform X2 [Camelina sativa]